MAKKLSIHPTHPQPRFAKEVAQRLVAGEVIIYPTDSRYAFGCALDGLNAQNRIRIARNVGKNHFFTLVCRDLGELARYAKVDNAEFRLIKSLTPGPFTFVLQATRELPRRLQDPKRKTVGLRIPDHPVVAALLDEVGGPILSTTVSDSEAELPMTEPDDLFERYGKQIDVFVDSGASGAEETTIIDCSAGSPVVARLGAGPVDDIVEFA